MNIYTLPRLRPILKYLLLLCTLFLVLPSAPTVAQTTGKIAFSSTRNSFSNIYVTNVDGTNVVNLTNIGVGATRTTNHSPSISPDASRVVFISDRLNTRAGTDNVYVVNTNGTGLARLTTDETRQDTAPCFSGDGTRIIWVRVPQFGTEYQLWTMNADGTNQRLFVSLPNSAIFASPSPSWSADNTKIAYTGTNGVVLVNSDGTNPITLPALSGTNGLAGTFNAINRDGTRIAFRDFFSGLIIRSATSDVRVGRIPDGDDGFFSPDGTRLVYRKTDGLYVASTDGTNQAKIPGTAFGDRSPSFGVATADGGTGTPGATPTPIPAPSSFYQISIPFADSSASSATTTVARALSLSLASVNGPPAHRLFRWNAVNQSYQMLNSSSIIRRGEGYFVFAPDADAASFIRQPEGDGTRRALSGTTFDITLRRRGSTGTGWNMIGFPFDPNFYSFSSWDNARVEMPDGRVFATVSDAVGAGVLQAGLRVFDSATGTNQLGGSILEPFRAYWVRTYVDGVRVRLTASVF